MCRTKPVSKCCCCLDLRMGSSLIAWIGFLWALCALTYSLVEYSLVPVLISLESLFLVLQFTLGIGAWRRKQILKRARQKFVQLTKALYLFFFLMKNATVMYFFSVTLRLWQTARISDPAVNRLESEPW